MTWKWKLTVGLCSLVVTLLYS